jgi:hypothetical protein
MKLKRKKKIITILILIIISYVIYVSSDIYFYGNIDELNKADAAIILGAGVWGDEPSPVFKERINHGIWLYTNDYVDKLIFTGGKGKGEAYSESSVAMNYAIANSVYMYQTINIIGSDNNFKSETYDFETTNISGTGSNEFVKVIVFGSIYSFELLEIIWDDNLESSDYRVLESIDFVRNKEIVIETTLPEGIPGEMIRWKDEEGNTYEQYLKYDGIGISGILILPK